MIYPLNPSFLHNTLLRNDWYYEAWLILWVMAHIVSNEWCVHMNAIRCAWMQSDAHECNPNVVCLILSDLQTREIHIKNMTPNFIKNKNGIYRRQVSILWPWSYEPHAHPAAPRRWNVMWSCLVSLELWQPASVKLVNWNGDRRLGLNQRPRSYEPRALPLRHAG